MYFFLCVSVLRLSLIVACVFCAAGYRVWHWDRKLRKIAAAIKKGAVQF